MPVRSGGLNRKKYPSTRLRAGRRIGISFLLKCVATLYSYPPQQKTLPVPLPISFAPLPV